MSFKIKRLTVGKGRTIGDEKAGKWERTYYELEAELEDERQVELAKGSMETLIEAWLKGETVGSQAAQPVTQDRTRLPYNIDKIPWSDRQNEKGPFQLCDDESNADFRNLRQFITQHSSNGVTCKDAEGFSWFVWLFPDQKTLGRKKSQFKKR